MEVKSFKVVRQGPLQQVSSQKAENNLQYKRELVLQTWGDKFGDTFVCATWGNLAQCAFQEGDLVFANLQFRTHEFQGVTYQDVTAIHISKIQTY